MSDTRKIEIKFGGELHEINIDLLVESLISYSLVTQEVAAYIAPGSTVNIKVKAPKEGSFTIILDLITENVPSLFTHENLQLATNLVVVVGGLYGLKKWLSTKGKPEVVKEKENESIEIRNKNGSIVFDKRVYNIYQNSVNTRENLRKTFTKLKEEEEISDFSIKDLDEEKQIFYVDKTDFEKMASDTDEIEQEKQKITKEKQELSLFKVVFRENYKWEFYYQGNKIYASLDDVEFFERIEKGEVAFRSGDRLIVDLEIEQVFNEAANTFINNSYIITKVVQHIPRIGVEQQGLYFEK
ncbi:MAG: hypothetical protein PHG69_00060 [Candidatus Omnitrophica bacterium]|nr:hypothetical protein [Candidatus Omnitrophota bacterium]